jgi:hypothetical protein
MNWRAPLKLFKKVSIWALTFALFAQILIPTSGAQAARTCHQLILTQTSAQEFDLSGLPLVDLSQLPHNQNR